MLNTTVAINGGLYEKQKSITVNLASVCSLNALFCRNDTIDLYAPKGQERMPIEDLIGY